MHWFAYARSQRYMGSALVGAPGVRLVSRSGGLKVASARAFTSQHDSEEAPHGPAGRAKCLNVYLACRKSVVVTDVSSII
jgi:hypothetical protein